MESIRSGSTRRTTASAMSSRGNRQLEGYKFRRQQIIGPYIVDFLSVQPKLIIEVDGGQHAERALQDAQRTE